MTTRADSWISLLPGLLLITVPACSGTPGNGDDGGDDDCGADCPDGGPGGDSGSGGEFTDTGDLFPDIASPGYVTITLHPSAAVTTGEAMQVAFGVPFPRALVDEVAQVRITDATDEPLPARVDETARWRKLGDDAAPTSVRAVAVITEVTFPSQQPFELRVHFGVAAGPGLPDAGEVTSTWVSAGQPKGGLSTWLRVAATSARARSPYAGSPVVSQAASAPSRA